MRHVGLVIFVLLCAVALTLPLPFDAPLLVGGVPFSLLWVVGWVLASFFVLLAYHVTGERR